ncbi:hypothetical protein OG298_21985 [Streptomyces sp. NBC_01005]|nr:hypothetical protein [Streptomyces sp. NBC_01362]WSW06826.1 hypothetical protein OG298_21985 [Streptomyces sp. NBC_01005]WTC96332.1 hypothetical protein OH736_22000 [Streptomyces sp. NBC_01650]
MAQRPELYDAGGVRPFTVVEALLSGTDVFGNTIQRIPRCCINCRDGHLG